VLLVTLDTTRPERLGPYGFEKARTPTLDRFATESIVYDDAYATSSWTLPSHASLLTGLLPMAHGAQSAPGNPDHGLNYGVRQLQESFTTLAEALSAAGYRTAAVIAGPALRRELGLAQGFDVYDDAFADQGERMRGRRAEQVADRAIELVDSFGDRPWFLFVNFFDPHAPYDPPPPFDEGLIPPAERDAGGGMNALALAHLLAGDAPQTSDRMDAALRTAVAAQLAGYDAEIAYMDAQLGRLLDAVAASPHGAETLVVITADHGESFGEHYYVSHGAHLYEDNVRVPLLVRAPGARQAGRSSEPVQNHVVFARMLRDAGIAELGDAAEGGPVVLQVQRSESNVRMFGKLFDRDLIAIYEPPYKLIESSDSRVELYDLAHDPGEVVNLATTEIETVTRLRTRLQEVRAAHPPQFSPDERARLRPDTAEALKALGYTD